MWRDFTRTLREVWQASGEAGGIYRPEKHYMRGPGPKWHAKYGHLYPRSEPIGATVRTSTQNLAERRA